MLKRIFAVFLSFILAFSAVEKISVNAATTNTMYSNKKIQNGSFENIDTTSGFSNGYKAVAKTDVEYWDTTASDGKFEYFLSSTKYHFQITKSNYPNNPEFLQVADGNVAAELNANEDSTIFQRINTVSGSTYTWGLNHRGRDTTDRMVLVIGPDQDVSPSKPSKTGKDQFVRITDWLKDQYNVDYPEIGCSKKYTVYTKPFAAKGAFENESTNEDENISMQKTDVINQEWSVWVISSPYCNPGKEITGIESKNGWSSYGTNTADDMEDIIKGENSSLGFDCTYTVPRGQTKTIFGFCSYSGGRYNSGKIVYDNTYGNLLDGIDFKLYQTISSGITEGGEGGVSISGGMNYEENIVINKDTISSNNPMHSLVVDGSECVIYTGPVDLSVDNPYLFIGAYVTIQNDDGTSETKFVTTYNNEDGLDDKDLYEKATDFFVINTSTSTDEAVQKWKYYYRLNVKSPVSVTMLYTKAPFVLYDSNGGAPYCFSPDNTIGGNLIGFGSYFQKVFDKEIDGEKYYVDTSDYYYDTTVREEDGKEVIVPGKYISHPAYPNVNWETGASKFCGWSVLNGDGKQVILDGTHNVLYDPSKGKGNEQGGMVSFTDGKNVVEGLQLDATHGVTLTAIWKFVHRAQAQTLIYDGLNKVFVNSAEGGTVEETLIPNDLREKDIKYTQDENGRTECVDAAGMAGDKIMFTATPDTENNYAFVGWYYREKQSDGTYQEVLRSTSTSIAVTIEEGKLNTYYARFQKKPEPLIFHYTPSGDPKDYDYYEKSEENKYGKYFQQVLFGELPVKPTGDSKAVKTWFTSPTERSPEYVFDFTKDVITKETHLYAGPSFAYNYYNYFMFCEPWSTNTYATIKFDGKYIDMVNDTNVKDYNVYMLRGKVGETAPSPKYVKEKSQTIKVGKKVSGDKIIFSHATSTGQSFNRVGTTYEKFYMFNMKAPVWVVFDFTYKGVTYTSAVKDRCLYNNIDVYMSDTKMYSSFPKETQAELREAQTVLLNNIQGMYDAVSKLEITEPTSYAAGSKVQGLTYDSTTDGTYSFSSTTAIRNIEPWGFKYSFTVDNQNFSKFADYGAVVLMDKDNVIKDKKNVGVKDLLDNDNTLMYSKTKGNVYEDKDNANTINVFYTDNVLSSDFNTNTYVAFFVKDSEGKVYFSNVVNNNYNDIASQDKEPSESAGISQSIMNYANSLSSYLTIWEEAKNSK